MKEPAFGPGPGAEDPERMPAQLYADLREIADRHLRNERADHTLQPTALVHEAWLRLAGADGLVFQNRHHFLRTASRAMRRVLVDHARARRAGKRDAGIRITLDEGLVGTGTDGVDLIALDDALVQLAAAEPRWAEVVDLRFFAGLEVTETAEVLGVSAITVKRDWRFARGWLAERLGAGDAG
ncbi:MAG: ECF-type sigma factor [Gemmatimonadales bacterium]